MNINDEAPNDEAPEVPEDEDFECICDPVWPYSSCICNGTYVSTASVG